MDGATLGDRCVGGGSRRAIKGSVMIRGGVGRTQSHAASASRSPASHEPSSASEMSAPPSSGAGTALGPARAATSASASSAIVEREARQLAAAARTLSSRPISQRSGKAWRGAARDRQRSSQCLALDRSRVSGSAALTARGCRYPVRRGLRNLPLARRQPLPDPGAHEAHRHSCPLLLEPARCAKPASSSTRSSSPRASATTSRSTSICRRRAPAHR